MAGDALRKKYRLTMRTIQTVYRNTAGCWEQLVVMLPASAVGLGQSAIVNGEM
jgi:hypothetical protein